MKTKTSDLIGLALDWAVAMALGLELIRSHDHFRKIATHWSEEQLQEHFSKSKNEWMHIDTVGNIAPYGAYSTSWAAGGPIIEREGLSLFKSGTLWFSDNKPEDTADENGPTPLIAAMRCYVAYKLGDEVDVPELT